MKYNICFNGIELIQPEKDEADEFSLYNIPTQELLFQRHPPQNAASSRHAQPISEAEINKRIAERVPKNTRKANSWSFRLWPDWARNRNAHPRTIIEPRFQQVPLDPLLCGREELDFWLCRFIVEIRREDGSEYPPNTLMNITSGLQRHMRENGKPETTLMSKNNTFVPTFQKAIDFRMKELTAKGIGVHRKRADPISVSDETKLWDTKTFELDTAKGLSNAVFFYNCKLFGFRGMDEHRDRFGRASKIFQGGYNQRKIEAKHITQWDDPGNPRDLISLYDKYLSIIPSVGPFYRRPLEQTCNGSGTSTPRFSKQVIGVNKLSTYVKSMFKDADISTDNRNISNHSGKVTCATTLYNHGFDNRAVTERSGHRSNAVEVYKRQSEQMLNEVSMALQPSRPDQKKSEASILPSNEQIAKCELSEKQSRNVSVAEENTIKLSVPSSVKKVIIEKDGKCFSMEI